MSNVRLVQRLYDSFARGDIPAVLGLFDEAISWREAEGNPYQPQGEPWIGPQAVMENLFVRLDREWDGFAAHPETIHDAGRTVVAEGRYTGTFLATGRTLDAPMCHVWSLDDGRITKFQQYVDTAQLRAVMGL